MKYPLNTPLAKILNTTPKYLKQLEKAGFATVEDFLEYFPRDYEDRSTITDMGDIRADKKNILIGELSNVRREKTMRRNFSLVKAVFTEENTQSEIECVWFKQPGLEKRLPQHTRVMVVGKAKLGYGKISLQSPAVENFNGTLHGKISPIYSDNNFIPNTWFARKFQESIIPLLEGNKISIPEILPEIIRKEKNIPFRKENFLILHSPESQDRIKQAKDAFALEELFILQLASLRKKEKFQELGEGQAPKIDLDAALIKDFFNTLPFVPTNAQKISIFEILKDMEKNIPMQRLLEGDVGAGKTLVALAACISVMKQGLQCAILAPTEILASQHFIGIQKDLERAQKKGLFEKWEFTNIKTELFSESKKFPTIEFLSGSIKGKKRESILRQLKTGEIDLLIGTHAILEDPVIFKNLGFVVVDEQHRFGVVQREKLLQKGFPHCLQMSATPIPRTLAIVAFGDQDISVLNELPPGRQTIETKVVPPKQRRDIEWFIDDQIQKGRQVFVICPLVEESEHFDELKSATEEFQRLEQHIFPHRKIALLHGRMHPTEKDKIMNDFKAKKYDILVSTSVVEVGVDVPNATIMLIEGAERFGLSQLHQFRGRVGRGEYKSYCFLFSTKPNANTRLQAMEKTTNGFELAEIDMNLRGPGEVFGLRQSGVPEMKMANLMDGRLVVEARNFAENFLRDEKIEKYTALYSAVKKREKMLLRQ